MHPMQAITEEQIKQLSLEQIVETIAALTAELRFKLAVREESHKRELELLHPDRFSDL
jgi:hypothetical protein